MVQLTKGNITKLSGKPVKTYKRKLKKEFKNKMINYIIIRIMEEVVLKEKKCNNCKLVKDISMFFRDKAKSDGFRLICKICTNLNVTKKTVTNDEKECKKCGVTKNVSMFHRDKNKPDGYRYMCKDCLHQYRNTTEEKEKRIEYRENTKEQWEQWYNSPEVTERRKQNKIAYRPIALETFKKKYQTDENFKLKILMRSQFKRFLAEITTTYENVLGCDLDFFKKWLEFRFDDKMTWENMGTVWEIDHILPLSKFNLSDKNEIKICGHWTNFQPLTTHDNRSKSNKIQLQYILNNIENVKQFNNKFNQILGYQAINESLSWLEKKTPGMVKIPRIDVSDNKEETENRQSAAKLLTSL